MPDPGLRRQVDDDVRIRRQHEVPKRREILEHVGATRKVQLPPQGAIALLLEADVVVIRKAVVSGDCEALFQQQT